MPQCQIAERQFLVEHYFKSYRYGRNNVPVPRTIDELKADIIRVISGNRQETLTFLYCYLGKQVNVGQGHSSLNSSKAMVGCLTGSNCV